MSSFADPTFSLLILADADAVILIRLIERIQSLALIPGHLSARWLDEHRLSIELICSGIDEPRIESLTRRVAQFTTVHSASWRRLPGCPPIG